ncbi:MAG: beta-lactamase family protein [bacterium]|nr:beta-lactamase family protein [bacterium]
MRYTLLALLLAGLACQAPEPEPVAEAPPEPVAPSYGGQWEDALPATEALEFHRGMTIGNWTAGGPRTRYIFLSMPEFFRHATIPRTGETRELAYKLSDDVKLLEVTAGEETTTFDAFVQSSPLDGVIVVHQGEIVYESYPRMRSFDRHVLMSASKVFAATLVAILEDRGLIDSTNTVGEYLPEAQRGWRNVPIRDVLDMASGIPCIETDAGAYSDPTHCYYQFEASLGWQPATRRTQRSTYDYVSGLRRVDEPGQAFEYSSVNTFLLAWLAEKVTGKRYAELLAEEVWSKMGAEADALLAVSRAGAPVAHGGISARLRDVARFGALFTPSGGDKIVSAAYLDKIQNGGRSELFEQGAIGAALIARLGGEKPKHNSSQWDFVMEDGDFFKAGYGGQGLYISPARDLVIAFFGTPDVELGANEMILVARQVATTESLWSPEPTADTTSSPR